MEQSRQLIVEPVAGLSNRIRAILSGWRLADISERSFRFLWKPDQFCGCEFTDLFVDLPERLESEPERPDLRYEDASSALIDTGGSNERIHVVTYQVLRNRKREPNILYEMAQYWDRLKPIEPVREAVELFTGEHFAEHTLGVHIRLGDHANHLRVDDAGLHEERMRAFEEAIDGYLSAHSESAVFVATDDGAPEEYGGEPGDPPLRRVVPRLRARFGERVVTRPPRSLDRHTPEAIQDALVELLLLNKADFVLGSPRSSFSWMATLTNIQRRKLPERCIRFVGPNLLDPPLRLRSRVRRGLAAARARVRPIR